jgi:hypothetical protein
MDEGQVRDIIDIGPDQGGKRAKNKEQRVLEEKANYWYPLATQMLRHNTRRHFPNQPRLAGKSIT